MHSPLLSRTTDKPAFDGEELVIVPSPFFPHKLVRWLRPAVLPGREMRSTTSASKTSPTSSRYCATPRMNSSASNSTIATAKPSSSPAREMLAATDEILTDNGIRTQGSPDTLAVWNAKK